MMHLNVRVFSLLPR